MPAEEFNALRVRVRALLERLHFREVEPAIWKAPDQLIVSDTFLTDQLYEVAGGPPPAEEPLPPWAALDDAAKQEILSDLMARTVSNMNGTMASCDIPLRPMILMVVMENGRTAMLSTVDHLDVIHLMKHMIRDAEAGNVEVSSAIVQDNECTLTPTVTGIDPKKGMH